MEIKVEETITITVSPRKVESTDIDPNKRNTVKIQEALNDLDDLLEEEEKQSTIREKWQKQANKLTEEMKAQKQREKEIVEKNKKKQKEMFMKKTQGQLEQFVKEEEQRKKTTNFGRKT